MSKSRRDLSIFDRIQQDIAASDYASARERLCSRLRSSGYDPDVLAQLET